MIWVDREVKKIKERKLSLERIDDMKTPSGRIHVGALRGMLIHDLLYKVLLENSIKAKFTWVFDDQDPMDAIPSYLEYDKWEQYAGMQLYKIPSPEPGFKSFAQYYAKEFQTVYESINCHPEIIWGSDLYISGKMNDAIHLVLTNASKIRAIYKEITKKSRPDDWHPFNPVCEKCQKIGTTYVYKWDGEKVWYRCREQAVSWARGCGHEGKVSPFDGNGKIPWKVEWACKWQVIGVTVEWAGKDHMSAGGSYEIASAVAKKVLSYPPPYAKLYEWFTTGGRKMSSSKGIGTSANDVAQILPPDLLRFLIVRTPVGTALDFNPQGDTIPQLFDDYDKCMSAYFAKIEDKIPDGKQGEVMNDFARIAELSAVRKLPSKPLFLPRFRTVANLVKTQTNILKFFSNQKGAALTNEEEKILKERVKFATIYIKNFAEESEKIQFLAKAPSSFELSAKQREFLLSLFAKLQATSIKDRETIQDAIFDVLKKMNSKPKEVFPAFYQSLIGRDFGPRAADLILEFGKEKVIKRLGEVTNS